MYARKHRTCLFQPHGLTVLWRILSGAVALAVAALAQSTAPAAEPAAPLVMTDFENPGAVELDPIQARANVVTLDGGHALEITTEAKAQYPGVVIKPREKKWNLEKFDEVRMDVHNPQDTPVRVLLSINNPGADGRKHCNTESVNVPPRGRATLVVPFGTWHGDPNHPIDQSNVVSVMVLLDRAGRSHRFVVDNIRAVPFDRNQMDKIFADPFFGKLKPVLGRGVNLGNALEAPKEGAWGVVLKAEYFDLIRSAGFDSVRIPVRWSAHAETSPPYRIAPEFFARVDWAIDQALSRQLHVVVNMHHYDGIMKEPDEHRARFLALWEQIAGRYKKRPAALWFELLNEPHDKLSAEKWNRILADAVPLIRRSNPTRKIVVGPAGWNSIGQIDNLKLPDDENLVATFHYYSPFEFTHQGASWVGGNSRAWLGTKWTGTKAQKHAVRRDLDKAVTWAVKHRRPIFLGEFGAYSKADLDSRARWTRFVADEAIRRKISFAYWEFCAGFGVYDPRRGQWLEPIKKALLPSE